MCQRLKVKIEKMMGWGGRVGEGAGGKRFSLDVNWLLLGSQ